VVWDLRSLCHKVDYAINQIQLYKQKRKCFFPEVLSKCHTVTSSDKQVRSSDTEMGIWTLLLIMTLERVPYYNDFIFFIW